jgi:hypothetical protein
MHIPRIVISIPNLILARGFLLDDEANIAGCSTTAAKITRCGLVAVRDFILF